MAMNIDEAENEVMALEDMLTERVGAKRRALKANAEVTAKNARATGPRAIRVREEA